MKLEAATHHLHVLLQLRPELVPLCSQLGQKLLRRRCRALGAGDLLLLRSQTRELLSQLIQLQNGKNKM